MGPLRRGPRLGSSLRSRWAVHRSVKGAQIPDWRPRWPCFARERSYRGGGPCFHTVRGLLFWSTAFSGQSLVWVCPGLHGGAWSPSVLLLRLAGGVPDRLHRGLGSESGSGFEPRLGRIFGLGIRPDPRGRPREGERAWDRRLDLRRERERVRWERVGRWRRVSCSGYSSRIHTT